MHYKIYLLDETDHIVSAKDEVAEADIDILIIAKSIAIKEGALEVWEQTRRVAKVHRDGSALLFPHEQAA